MAFMEMASLPKDIGQKVQDWNFDEWNQVAIIKLKNEDYVSDDEVLITTSNFIIQHICYDTD